MVVDRLTKYTHFIPMSHPYNVDNVVQAFLDNIFKLHGMPIASISGRDKIFTSKAYQDLFKSLNVEVRLSTSHHPETDGQTERLNQCVEAYLGNMVFQNPKSWL